MEFKDVELTPIGNQVELGLFDVYTDWYLISQFQTIGEHKEVSYETNN